MTYSIPPSLHGKEVFRIATGRFLGIAVNVVFDPRDWPGKISSKTISILDGPIRDRVHPHFQDDALYGHNYCCSQS